MAINRWWQVSLTISSQHVGAALLGCAIYGVPLTAQEIKPAPSKLSSASDTASVDAAPAQERNKLLGEAQQLQAAGKIDSALAAARKLLELDRATSGRTSAEAAQSLELLAALQEAQSNFSAAVADLAEALTIKRTLYGDKNWQTIDARLALADLKRRATMTAAQRQQLKQAAQTNLQAMKLFRAGKFAEALPLSKQAADIWRTLLGADHPDYATALNAMGLFHASLDQRQQAEPLYRQAMAIRERALGKQHPLYALGLNNIAGILIDQGDAAGAEAMYRQALQIVENCYGSNHRQVASALNNLGELLSEVGDCRQAEPLLLRALEIYRATVGEQHAEYRSTVNNLAMVYMMKGDFASCEPLLRQALDDAKQNGGDRHPEMALRLNNLASLYAEMGDSARAEPLYQQALRIIAATLGEQHTYFVRSLHNLAILQYELGRLAEAEKTYLQVVEIYRRTVSEQHPEYAASLGFLAMIRCGRGDFQHAEPLFRQSLELIRKTSGPSHRAYAMNLHNLGLLYKCSGEYERAEPMYREALEITKRSFGESHPDYVAALEHLAVLHAAQGDQARAGEVATRVIALSHQLLDRTAAVQSQRQQLRMTQVQRRHLDTYLSLAPAANLPTEEVYGEVLAWKGSVSARQQLTRAIRTAEQDAAHPEVGRLYVDLGKATQELANLYFAAPAPGELERHRNRLDELSTRVERLEQSLATASLEFRRQLSLRKPSAQELATALPTGTALVDFLEYGFTPADGSTETQLRLVAFVSDRDRPVATFELGAVEPIDAAVEKWRKAYDPASAQEIRRLVWEPLQERLAGAKTVLVSPDGPLARFPLAALPGRRPGTYLIEEVAIGVVPIPSLLRPATAVSAKPDASPSLLLVGDPEYDESPADAPIELADTRSAPRGLGSKINWPSLPGTSAEVAALRESWRTKFDARRIVELTRLQATEAEFRHQAPKHAYLHIATHGFFAAPRLKSAVASTANRGDWHDTDQLAPDVAGFHPDLLSGLVLSGANLPVAVGRDDGILTALEVSELDLRGVRLATLSACETGLGAAAGGEGLLGLQRAFQTAGARSVVASLWKVDDEATLRLMTDFYRALWQKRLPPIEALRRAQLDMLNGKTAIKGIDLSPDEDKPNAARLSPRLWAAFVLSGIPE